MHGSTHVHTYTDFSMRKSHGILNSPDIQLNDEGYVEMQVSVQVIDNEIHFRKITLT